MYLKRMLFSSFLAIFHFSLFTSCVYKRGLSYPASLVRIDEKNEIYLDYRPISNVDWREYMYYQKNTYGEHSEEYLETWPDTSVWKKIYPEESFGNSLIMYANAPIVGISHSQAAAYCRWRTEVVNQKFSLKFRFELPSQETYLRVIEKKKFITVSELPNTRSIPGNTFYHFCGDLPEYTDHPDRLWAKSKQTGQCGLQESERTEYTSATFRCVAIRQKK